VRRAGRVCVAVASICLVVFLLFVELPQITGVGWDDTTDRIAGLPVVDVLTLVSVWAAGLAAHTMVLRGALPGLTSRRAWVLNLSGSGVSNVLPLGGAAGVGLNYAMLRSWGYDRDEITAFAVLTNAIVTLVKAAIAVLGLVVLLHTGGLTARLGERNVHHVDEGLALVAVLACLALFVARGSARRWFRTLRAWLVRHCRSTLRHSWRSVVIGGISYPLLQLVMFAMCLDVLHARASLVAIVSAYAVDRLCTLVPITPGGVGLVETMTTATLVTFGVDAPAAVAGVVLFRIFSYLIEIPLGGLVAATWVAQRSRQHQPQA
jgi:putative heme transporter